MAIVSEISLVSFYFKFSFGFDHLICIYGQ